MKVIGERITGIIPLQNENLAFYGTGYQFNLMSTDSKESQMKKLIPSDNGFLNGKTYEGRSIFIYVGNSEIPIKKNIILNTNAFLLSTTVIQEKDMDGFYGIEFLGGTLNSLVDRNSMKFSYNDGRNWNIERINNRKNYKANLRNEECKIKIGSDCNFSDSINGLHVNDTGGYLRLEFTNKQSLSTIFDYFGIVKELVSFMSFRSNIGFDQIYLLREPDEVGLSHRSMQLFLRNDYDFTKKNYFNSITFNDLDDSIVPLIELLAKNNDKESSYMLGFIPESTDELIAMTNSKVRETCSALECELGFITDLSAEEDAKLQNLTIAVKTIIKEHKKGEDKLLPKTYDLIFSSIRNWSMTASNKISMLFHRYDQEMVILNPSSIDVNDDMIDDFVKFRNHITHGSYRVMNQKINLTTYVLQGLVYCCILTRIGMSREKILFLCQENKILK